MTTDLTALYSDPFEFRIRNGEKTLDMKLDFDQVLIDLQQLIPTAFRPTDQIDAEGNPKIGMAIVFDCFKTGTPIPEDLPSLNHLQSAIDKAFKLPNDPGNTVRVRMAVLTAWMVECARRDGLKKNITGSPSSTESTPVLSA